MAQQIRIEKIGGPEVMQWVECDLPTVSAKEVRIRQHACGLNFIDVYFRTGLYPQPLPAGLGMEAAGEVLEVGAEVEEFKVGDRVAYAGRPVGAYASERIMPTDQLVKLPDDVDYETAAAMMLQGMTVEYLFYRTFPLQVGQTILFHAAAGGVGLIACQWAKALGVQMIGTVGSPEKAALAKAHGCAHVIDYSRENVVQRVREITAGKGVPVVYDSVGKDTFTASLDCLSPFGLMVSFGNASGAVPPFQLSELTQRGALYITRPTLMAHTVSRVTLLEMAQRLFGMVSSGQIKIAAHQRYALRDVAQAHHDLEARRTIGKSILLP